MPWQKMPALNKKTFLPFACDQLIFINDVAEHGQYRNGSKSKREREPRSIRQQIGHQHGIMIFWHQTKQAKVHD